MRLLSFSLGFLVASSAAAVAGDLSILLPLYSYPNWYAGAAAYEWDDVASAAAQVPITAIINPNSGPNGGPPNADYVHGMADLAAAGVTMVGYVATNYGNTALRPLAAVKLDIDIYEQSFSAHGVSGIFLDEASNAPGMVAYYAELYAYIRSKPHLGKVFANPGTQVPEAYVSTPTADSTVIFENTSGWSSYVPDSYVGNYGRERFSALMLNVPSVARMKSAVDLAVQRNVGYVYVTDDNILAAPNDNPFDRLPSYWTTEVSYVASVPEPGSAGLALAGGVFALRRRRR
jgi:hypothetical protein